MVQRTKDFGIPHSHLPEPKVIRTPFQLKEPLVDVDPITYEIIRHRIQYVGLTIGETLKKVSGTIVTAEANDMSTYITLEDGAPVFLGPYVILHSGIADLLISNVIKLNLEDPGIRDGDMFFINDPWLGPAHQCDCAIVSPIFLDEELYIWTGVTVHQLDMGGVDPGGLCPHAKDVYAEPSLYPAIKIVENHKLKMDIDRLLRRNSRMPGILALDIRSMIAANFRARKDMLELVRAYGKDVVKSVMILVQNYTAEKFRERLRSLPRGTFRGRDWYEIGGADPDLQDEIMEIQCTLTNTGEKLVFDFSGTSTQSGGFANCGIGGMRSGVIAGFIEPIAYDLPWNAGILVNIELISQEGTTNNPLYPAAVSDGITEGSIGTATASSNVVANMLLGHKELREKTLIVSGAGFLGNTLGGMNEKGEVWGTLLMDVIGMACMPTSIRDGLDMTGSSGIPFTQYANVETNELHYPLLYLHRGMGQDAWGHGYHRGGRALELAFKPHKTAIMLMLLWNHGAEFPNSGGISGGLPASAVRFKFAMATDIMEKFEQGYMPATIDEFEQKALAAKSETYLGPADIVYFGVPGGAGYGDTLRREPERVLRDVQNNILSLENAEKFYGVVIQKETGELDLAATEKRRQEITDWRLTEGMYPSEWERFAPKPDTAAEGQSRRSSPGGTVSSNSNRSYTTLFEVGMGLKVARSWGGKHVWVCSECGHLYGPAEENPKMQSKLVIGQLRDLAHPTAQMTRLEYPRFFFRQFLCPECGIVWATEVARPEDPILFTIEYNNEWLASLPSNRNS